MIEFQGNGSKGVMSCRKFVWINLIGIFSLLLIGGAVVFTVDPFYHYHGPAGRVV